MPWIRVVLSVFIFYHLFAAVLAPLSTSLLGRELAPYYKGYANILGFNSPVGFLTPYPMDNVRLEYEVRFPEVARRDAIQKNIPEWFSEGTLNSTERRELFLAEFFHQDQSRMINLLGPQLCEKLPEASEVILRTIVQKLPDLDEAIALESGWSEEVIEEKSPAYTHYCQEYSESEAL